MYRKDQRRHCFQHFGFSVNNLVLFSLSLCHPELHTMQRGITRHLLDLVADTAQHSYYSSQCWRGERYSGALHAHLWMLFKKVRGVWLCCTSDVLCWCVDRF